MADLGAPVAFTALPRGVPAYDASGDHVGRVARVLVDEGTGMFDGLVVDTDGGERFVDAPEVGALGEQGAEIRLSAAEIAALPAPKAAAGPLRRVWSRITGS